MTDDMVELTHASRTAGSTVASSDEENNDSWISSSALAFVVLSFFPKFLNATTRWESEIPLRSGSSVMYESDECVDWKAAEDAPKPKEAWPNAVEAARALEACDLNFLLMISLC